MSNPRRGDSFKNELLGLDRGLTRESYREYRRRLDTFILRTSRRERIMRLGTIIITGIALFSLCALLLLSLFVPIDRLFYGLVDLVDPQHGRTSPLYDFVVVATFAVSVVSILFAPPLISLYLLRYRGVLDQAKLYARLSELESTLMEIKSRPPPQTSG